MRFLSLVFTLAFLLALACNNGQLATPSAAPVRPTAVYPVNLDYLLGKFDPATHPDFIPVSAPYTNKPGMMLRKETLEAFKKMFEAAKKDGVTLRIISSTRTFWQQKDIWEGKWTRFAKEAPAPQARALKILEYSAMPGASRHHWGTDVDLNDLNNPSFKKGGAYATTYDWLAAHAHEFGFCQPYSEKGPARPNGYNEERWHWSYMPLAQDFLNQYLQNIHNEMITGFSGAETATEIDAVGNYVSGINPDCKK